MVCSKDFFIRLLAVRVLLNELQPLAVEEEEEKEEKEEEEREEMVEEKEEEKKKS